MKITIEKRNSTMLNYDEVTKLATAIRNFRNKKEGDTVIVQDKNRNLTIRIEKGD